MILGLLFVQEMRLASEKMVSSLGSSTAQLERFKCKSWWNKDLAITEANQIEQPHKLQTAKLRGKCKNFCDFGPLDNWRHLEAISGT
ncbi:Hypothetical predicted protein [Drosophila guanche]|uniref:Uncharacterized protein n=1 Tax=Drosophila guanche TaxID=7266 RepID=A0A3B0JID3_DROGU|nr:Hypothetical predicted protein [Drosophila guanche]